jgi:hypothetical protein
MEYATKIRLPLHSTGIIYSSSLLTPLSIGIIFTLIYLYQWGESIKIGLQSLRFWRFMPKGEKILSPKQKDRTTNFKKIRNKDLFGFHICLFFNWYLVMTISSIGTYRDKFSKLVSFKTLLKIKRSISFRGSFVFSKEKHLKQGEKFQILKMLLTILFIYL